jgi:sialic acid synthase SpsE
MHLAMAMVVDLELNKSPLGRSRLKNVVEMGKGFEVPIGVTDHNLDEKRAFLGCLYLCSVYAVQIS